MLSMVCGCWFPSFRRPARQVSKESRNHRPFSEASGLQVALVPSTLLLAHHQTRIHCSFALHFTVYFSFFRDFWPEAGDTLLASNRGLSWQQCNLCLSISSNRNTCNSQTFWHSWAAPCLNFLLANLHPKESCKIDENRHAFTLKYQHASTNFPMSCSAKNRLGIQNWTSKKSHRTSSCDEKPGENKQQNHSRKIKQRN